MNLYTPLARLGNVLRGSNPRHRSQQSRTLELLQLEDRCVPSILFSSTYEIRGERMVIDSHGPVITSAQVDLVFWGSRWHGLQDQFLLNDLTTDVGKILDGPYFDGLSQYRNIGHGSLQFRHLLDNSDPGTTFTDGDVRTFLRTNIGNGNLPSPTAQRLYMVIPQRGSTLTGADGDHAADFDSHNRIFHYGVTTNYTGISIGAVTTILSHELVEAATNPEVNITIGGVNQAAWHVPGNVLDEIGDGPAQNYSYRVNGVLVQSYLSNKDHAYIVPTGQIQTFHVSSSGGLTINGDQLANKNDWIALDDIYGSVRAYMNGETVQFERFAINSVVINTKTGNDLVQIQGNSVPVTVNLGDGTDTVEVGQLYNNLDRIKSTVNVHGGMGHDTLNVYDSANTSNQTYTLTASTLRRTGSALITYDNLASNGSVNLTGSQGNDTYDITSKQTITTLNTGGGNSTVNVGSPSNGLDDFQRFLTVNGSSASAASAVLNLNDQASSTPGMGYVVQESYVNRAVVGFGALVYYANISSLVVNAGSGANDDIAISGTLATTALTINAGAGGDTVHHGSILGGNLSFIQGPLTVNGQGGNTTLSLFDQSTTTAQTYTVTATSVTRTGGFALTYSNIQSLTLQSGVGDNLFEIKGTAAGTTTILDGSGASSNSFDVSSDDYLLDGIQGELRLRGSSTDHNFESAKFSDAGHTDSQEYFVAADTLTRFGVAPIHYENLVQVILLTGDGGATIHVQESVRPPVLHVSCHGVSNTLYGPDADVLWQLTGRNSGTLSVGNTDNTIVQFGGIQNLIGGAGDDTFAFIGGPGVGVDGQIDGGAGTNILDYSAYTGAVVVDLPNHLATGVDGGVYNIDHFIPPGGMAPQGDGRFLAENGVPALDAATVLRPGRAGLDLFFGDPTLDRHDWAGTNDLVVPIS